MKDYKMYQDLLERIINSEKLIHFTNIHCLIKEFDAWR